MKRKPCAGPPGLYTPAGPVPTGVPAWRRTIMAGKSGQPQGTKPGERIAKVMARAGLCSRREAEAWIAAGRVAVNGKPIASPALDVGPQDRILVDGRELPARERTRLFLYNKPRG